MKNQIEIIYEGDLRTKAIHLASGSEIITDAPLDNQGKGEYFSPTDLVCSALGSCMLTIMAIASRKHNLSIVGSTIEIKKQMSSGPRMISKIELNISLANDFNEKHRTILERAALSCPVHRSLSPEVEVNVNFIYA